MSPLPTVETLPPVTVVIVTVQKHDDQQSLTGPVLAAIKSVEDQDYPAAVETVIVRNVQNHSPREMQRYGVFHARTEWVALIRENHVWEPWSLKSAMQHALVALNVQAFVGHYGSRSIAIARRDHYLQHPKVWPV